MLSGVKYDSDISEVVNKTNSCSFADIEKILVEAIKTMILDNRDRLAFKDILDQISNHSISLKAARLQSK